MAAAGEAQAEALLSPGFTARGRYAAVLRSPLRQPLLDVDGADSDVEVSSRAGDARRSSAGVRLRCAALHGRWWLRRARAAQRAAHAQDAPRSPSGSPSTRDFADDSEDEEPPEPPKPSFRRLLAFARPEAPWITLGLLALLLRLPFSLAMPHFVSVALGRVIAGDYGAAQARHAGCSAQSPAPARCIRSVALLHRAPERHG